MISIPISKKILIIFQLYRKRLFKSNVPLNKFESNFVICKITILWKNLAYYIFCIAVDLEKAKVWIKSKSLARSLTRL